MSDVNGLLLEEIVQKKKFHHVFQPLYDLNNWKIFGYEALLRCKYFQNPENLFHLAMEKNRLYDLDSSSIYHALKSVNAKNLLLFVNIYPSTMTHPSFPDFLEKLKRIRCSNRNLVFEINEAEKIMDMESLRKATHFLKDKGYAIALDDFGKGESSLRTLIKLEPDFVKLDKYFSVDLSVSTKKQEMIKMLLDFCKDKHMKLVLEGIEEPPDLAMAKALGVHLGQGFVLGKPFPIRKFHYKKG